MWGKKAKRGIYDKVSKICVFRKFLQGGFSSEMENWNLLWSEQSTSSQESHAFMEEGAFVVHTREGQRGSGQSGSRGEEWEAAMCYPRRESGTTTPRRQKIWNKELVATWKNSDALNYHLIVGWIRVYLSSLSSLSLRPVCSTLFWTFPFLGLTYTSNSTCTKWNAHLFL